MKLLFLFISAILLVCLGCTPSETSIQTAIARTRAVLPTDTSVPFTSTPTLTLQPSPSFTPTHTWTPSPSPTPSMFFTEEFDQPLNEYWTLKLYGPNKELSSKVKTQVIEGNLNVNITHEEIYAYYFYDQFSYTDVRLDMRAENSGRRTNNISLICRKSDAGWYEFSVGSDAAWYLFYVQLTKNASAAYYHNIANGSALPLNQGNDTNEYTMICEGHTITLMVNGVELKGSPLNAIVYKIDEGSVGMNVSSLNVIPVIVDIDWLKISPP